MFRWGATVIACLGLTTMTGCGLGIEGESPEVSFKSKAEERGAEGETHSGKPGGPNGSGDHETGAQLSGDTLKSSDEGTGGGGSSSGEQATTAREGNTETTGVLPKPGPFDPTAPGFELFDPCSEAFDKNRTRTGVNNKLGETRYSPGSRSCMFTVNFGEQEGLLVEFASSDKPLADHIGAGLNVGTGSDPENGIYILNGMLFDDSTCSSFRETNQGTMIVTANGIKLSERSERCEYAVVANKVMLEQKEEQNAG